VEDQLDGFSLAFAKALFDAYPDWRKFSRVDIDERNGSRYFVTEIAPPRGSQVVCPLQINTWNDEVTITLDHFHEHFDWRKVWDDSPTGHPLAFIAAVLSDEIGAVSYWNKDNWLGSMAVVRGSLEDAIARQAFLCQNEQAIEVRVRSWKGKLDEDIRLSGAIPGSSRT
jgi:hypothetical protein